MLDRTTVVDIQTTAVPDAVAGHDQKASMKVEAYYVSKGDRVPNNSIPVIVYRSVLPQPHSADSAQKLCEANGWQKRVITFMLHKGNVLTLCLKGRMGRD